MTEITVALDRDAEHAMATLLGAGMTRSEAVSAALVELERTRRRRTEGRGEALRAEVRVLERDEGDHAEMRAVSAVMRANLAPGRRLGSV